MLPRVLLFCESAGGVGLCCCCCLVLSLYRSRTGVNIDCCPTVLGCFGLPSGWEWWMCALCVVVWCRSIIVPGGRVVVCVGPVLLALVVVLVLQRVLSIGYVYRCLFRCGLLLWRP